MNFNAKITVRPLAITFVNSSSSSFFSQWISTRFNYSFASSRSASKNIEGSPSLYRNSSRNLRVPWLTVRRKTEKNESPPEMPRLKGQSMDPKWANFYSILSLIFNPPKASIASAFNWKFTSHYDEMSQKKSQAITQPQTLFPCETKTTRAQSKWNGKSNWKEKGKPTTSTKWMALESNMENITIIIKSFKINLDEFHYNPNEATPHQWMARQ